MAERAGGLAPRKGWYVVRNGNDLLMNMHTYRVLLTVALLMGIAVGLAGSAFAWAVCGV